MHSDEGVIPITVLLTKITDWVEFICEFCGFVPFRTLACIIHKKEKMQGKHTDIRLNISMFKVPTHLALWIKIKQKRPRAK